MNSCDYFQYVAEDFDQLQAIKKKWRIQNSVHQSPQMKISIDEMPAKVFQLPEVFMTSRLNHNKQSFRDIPKKARKASNISLNSLEISPKFPVPLKSAQDKYKELTELHKSYDQYKKMFHKIKQEPLAQTQQKVDLHSANSTFYLNGVKLPYSLYMINKNRQIALNNIMNNTTNKIKEESKQQMEIIDNEIKKVRSQNQSKQKIKEYRSRSYLHNAYYSMLCVNSDSKKRLKKIFQHKFSQESRFQQM